MLFAFTIILGSQGSDCSDLTQPQVITYLSPATWNAKFVVQYSAFLKGQFAEENIKFLNAVNSWNKQNADAAKLKTTICTSYIKGSKQINVDDKTRNNAVIACGQTPTPVDAFDAAAKIIRSSAADKVTDFITSPECKGGWARARRQNKRARSF